MLKQIPLISVMAMFMAFSVGVASAEVSLVNQYDPNGNLVSGDGKYYEYNDANQLARVRENDQNGKVIAEYYYDFSGQRVKKVENGVSTYYIGKHYETNVVAGKTDNSSYFFADGERVAKKDATGTYFYHPDHLGGVNAVSNAAGAVFAKTSYLPFGEIRQGGQEKFSYTGKEKDKATDLYYFDARFNSPELRHFTQADSAAADLSDPQDLNRYAYVGNNPLSFVDPDGHKKKKKAKLSKREKWMIEHGVDPDHDKTTLKSAKKQEKAGKKYSVAAKAATPKASSFGLSLAQGSTFLQASNNGQVNNASFSSDNRKRLTAEEKRALKQEQMEMLAQAAYYSALADGYEETMKVTITASLGAVASVLTLGFGPAVMGTGAVGLGDFGGVLFSGALDIWDTYEDSKVSNTVSSGVSLIDYGRDLYEITKWLH